MNNKATMQLICELVFKDLNIFFKQRQVTKFIIIFLFIVLPVVVLSKPISDVLGTNGNNFDPWNKERWADWYDGDDIVEPFEIDINICFANRDTPWKINLEKFFQVNGNASAVFHITAKEAIVIDGNCNVIDARRLKYQSWTCKDWYTQNINPKETVLRVFGFRFTQHSESEAPTIFKNITLMGFWRAVETAYFQDSRPVIWDNITTKFNICGMYTTGKGGLIKNCDISENIHLGIYADSASWGWSIENNVFKDNNFRGARSWAAITLDACYLYNIRNNKFITTYKEPKDYCVAISLYRNQGELFEIREFPASWNLIDNNTFKGYNLAIDLGVRNGKKESEVLINLAKEGRCYVEYNTVRDNNFDNCIIGILIRTSYNAVDNNVFKNVEVPIALNNVFYSLHHILVNNQSRDTVSIWSESSTYDKFRQYVAYHDELGARIKPTEKFYHIISHNGTPILDNPSGSKVVISDEIVQLPLNKDGYFNTFNLNVDQSRNLGFTNKPVDFAIGSFGLTHPESDFAVIFDKPFSQINEEVKYSIVIYDQNGSEYDRCGRSDRRWTKIIAGNFLPDSRQFREDKNNEIIAFSSEPDEKGYYPLYVFSKGIADPIKVLLPQNMIPIKDWTTGNFNTDDNFDEIAIVFEKSSQIVLLKPNKPEWKYTIKTNISNIKSITAGEFNDNKQDGEEVAVISESVDPIYFFCQSKQGAYLTLGERKIWEKITRCNFDIGNNTDEIVGIRRGNNGSFFNLFNINNNTTFTLKIPNYISSDLISIKSGRYVKKTNYGNVVNRHQIGGYIPYSPKEVKESIALLPFTVPESIPVQIWLPVSGNSNSFCKDDVRLIPILK